MPGTRTSAACSILSIRCRRCRNRRSFWQNCATSSATGTGGRRYNAVRAGFRSGSPAPGRCRRRRAATFSPSRAPPSRLGQGAERAAGRRSDTDVELPRIDGAAEAGTQSSSPNSRIASRSVPPKCGAFNSPPASSRDKALAMYARAIKRLSAVIGDQDPSLLSSLMRSRGTRAFYQGCGSAADTRPAADDLATASQGGGACFVLKNRGVPGDQTPRRIVRRRMNVDPSLARCRTL